MTLKISDREREILFCAQLSADASAAEIAARAKTNPQTVRRTLSKFLREGVIEPYHFIRVEALGASIFELFVACAGLTQRAKGSIERALISSPFVRALHEVSGPFNYRISIASLSGRSLDATIEELLHIFGDHLLSKVVAVRRSGYLYPRKHLAVGVSGSPVIELFFGDPHSIDDIDHEILSALAADGALRMRDLSRRLSVPLTTIDFRIKRLKRQGILFGRVYSVRGQKLGWQDYHLTISLRGGTPKRLESFLASHRHTVFLIRSLGSWDYEVGLEILEAKQLLDLVAELHEHFGASIARIETFQILNVLKYRMYPFEKNPTATRADAQK